MKIKLSVHRIEDHLYQFDQKWDVPRECVFSARLNLDHINYNNPKKLAELLFHVTNAPVEIITKPEEKILLALWENCLDKNTYYSISVGDVVNVYDHNGNGTSLLCKSIGWEEKNEIN